MGVRARRWSHYLQGCRAAKSAIRLWARILIRSMRFLSRELDEVGSDGRDPKTMGVERLLMSQDTPGDAGEFVGQRRGEFVAVKP